MITIKHRINTTNELLSIDSSFGIEIDIRCSNGNLVLSHDPYENGEDLESFLKLFNHKILVLNIKDSGIEDDVLEITKKYLVDKEFFLLDIEIPYLVSKKGIDKEHLSSRFSEYESFESLFNFRSLAEWVWIDTFSNLPYLNKEIVDFLRTKKTCLVSPERWGRKEDLSGYLNKMKDYDIEPDFLMS